MLGAHTHTLIHGYFHLSRGNNTRQCASIVSPDETLPFLDYLGTLGTC